MTEHHPRFGFTRHGAPVHEHTTSNLPHQHWYDRANSWLAVKVTSGVGTMWCAYAFTAIALISLKSTLAEHSVNADIQWVAQTFLQLVLLSVIIVGQNLMMVASDARAARTLEDAEAILRDAAEIKQSLAELGDVLTQLAPGFAAKKVKTLRSQDTPPLHT